MKILRRIEIFMARYFGGHVSIGPITIYGENAMHWGVEIRVCRKGWLCFRLPFLCYSRWWPLYLYFSPNATPQCATFKIGKKHF